MPENSSNGQNLIAYFCMEFALRDDFHIFSGGLGVLAGDFLLEADQQKLPVVGVGLMYSSVFSQQISLDHVTDQETQITPEKVGLTPVTSPSGERVIVHIPFQSKILKVQAWRKQLNTISLLLLDTNFSDNPPEFRAITDKLYFGEKDHRLLQELVLGIGGLRLLMALGLNISMIHMNKGHAAFCAFERIFQLMQVQGIGFSEALNQSKRSLVFSNHTLIPAGNDSFANDLLTVYLSSYAESCGISLHSFLELGSIPDSNLFSMTTLGLNTAGKTAAVSVYHSQKAKEIWPQYQLIPVTNGIYLPRWYAPEKNYAWLLDEERPTNPVDFWHAHQECKDRLVKFIADKTGKRFSSQGLIVTWARRFVQYKRPEALFWQLPWLEHIIKHAGVNVYFVFAGKGHPHDQAAREMVEHVLQVSQDPQFTNSITYLPNYNLELAQYLVEGSDVWLNTPIEGFEACGTSGMKAGLNGVLQCTTNDGWVREVSWHDIGWMLDSDHISESLYTMLEQRIIPLFLQRDQNGTPKQWLERMIETAQIIRQKYSATRMLQEYKTKLYQESTNS